MLNIKVFSGSSHPELVDLICTKIGTTPGRITTGKFANQETKVEIGVSKDAVFSRTHGNPKFGRLNWFLNGQLRIISRLGNLEI